MKYQQKDPIHRERAVIASSNVTKGRTKAHRGHGNPAISDRVYDADEYEFLKAMERYITTCGRRFPTWAEALQVLKSLGYSRLFGGESPWIPSQPNFWEAQRQREIVHTRRNSKYSK